MHTHSKQTVTFLSTLHSQLSGWEGLQRGSYYVVHEKSAGEKKRFLCITLQYISEKKGKTIAVRICFMRHSNANKILLKWCLVDA